MRVEVPLNEKSVSLSAQMCLGGRAHSSAHMKKSSFHKALKCIIVYRLAPVKSLVP